MSSTSSSPSFSISSSSSSSGCSDDGLRLGQVPLVHAVVAHQLVRAGKLLLTVGPAAGEGLLTWREGDKQGGKQKITALEQLRPEVLLNSNRVFQNLRNIYIYVWVCVNNKEEENKGIRTCFTCMNPCVRLKMIWPWKLSLTRLTLKGLHSYTEMHTVAAVTETDVERVQSLCTYTYGARFIKLKKARFKR